MVTSREDMQLDGKIRAALNKAVADGHVERMEDGSYRITDAGREHLRSLEKHEPTNSRGHNDEQA